MRTAFGLLWVMFRMAVGGLLVMAMLTLRTQAAGQGAFWGSGPVGVTTVAGLGTAVGGLEAAFAQLDSLWSTPGSLTLPNADAP